MPYATQDILDWAAGSQPLAFIGERKKQALKGGAFDLDLHIKIYVERQSLQWQYDQDPDDEDGILYGQGNYVYALCFPYILEAMLAVGGGQVVVPGSGSTVPDQLNFTVAASGTTLIDGQSSATLSSFIGFNLVVVRNGTPLTQITSAPIYYTWVKATGVLTVVPAAFLGDEFQITAV